MFQTLHFQQRIKRIILIYHAARRCISLMPQAATNGIEWLHSAFVFIRCTFRCIVHCINSSYSEYSLLKKASETSIMIIIQICFTTEPRSGLMTDSGLSFGCSKRFIVQQRIKRIILIYHAARRCIFLMPQAATNGIEWLHSAFVFIRCTLGCIVYCINSSYSKYSLLKKASETSVTLF